MERELPVNGTQRDAGLCTLPFKALSGRRRRTVSGPIASCYYHSRSGKVSCLTGIPSAPSVREHIVTSAAPGGDHEVDTFFFWFFFNHHYFWA